MFSIGILKVMEKTITVIVVRRKLTKNKSKTIKVKGTIVKRNKVKTMTVTVAWRNLMTRC